MTRAELHSTINKQGNMEIADAIDDVILHYEARTCETCTHYDEGYCNIITHQSFIDMANLRVAKSFGCNKWQPKD